MTAPILDGSLADWTSADRLESPATTIAGYQMYGRYSDGTFYFALQSSVAIGANTTLWLNTDKNTGTGYQVWGFASGAEFNVNFGADGVPRLYTGSDGQQLVGNLTYALSADKKTLEIALPKTLLGSAVTSVDLMADVNNSVFLPGDYTQPAYRIADLTTIPPGPYDGLLTDWTQTQRLDTDANAVAGYEVYGKVDTTKDAFVFGIKSAISIGANSTFWLNTDNDTSTGYKIWGFTGGDEFNVNIGTDGVARLYKDGAGQTFVANIEYAIAPDQHSIEFAVARSVIGTTVTSINLLADINDSVFLPPSYGSGAGYALVDPGTLPPSTYDGSLADWTQAQRIDGTDNTSGGYEIYGKTTVDSFVFAVKSAVAIGANSTFWLNTDGNTATGYKIWGWAGGEEFNVNIGNDGVARLYKDGAGQTLVGTIDYALSADKHTIEFGVLKSVLGTSVDTVTMLADINDSVFLPSSYGTMAGFTVHDTSAKFDGLLTEWTAPQRLDGAANGTTGYEIYGRVDPDSYVFAMKSAMAIGPNTTFWLNTDDNVTTGYKVFGTFGAEYNVNIGPDGVARLYTGGAGETLVGAIDYALAPDKMSIEFGVLKSVLGPTVTSVTMVADVNDSVFLPSSYGTLAGFKIVDTAATPPSAFDGVLNEWSAAQRLETPLNATDGYELYGKYSDGGFVFGIKSAAVIGPNTTFWLNTDGNTATGFHPFSLATGGAEYNVNIGVDGVARLYSGGAGETLVGNIDYKIGPDGTTMEFAVPASMIGNVSKVGMIADINDNVFLPGDYATKPEYVLQDPATLPAATYEGHKIAIVYSATTAANFFNEMAYSQLIMNAQSQAMSAGVTYDLISETDLTDISKLANYDAIVFPSFRNVPANYQAIADTLTQYVYDYHKSIITAGDFMTNAADDTALPGDSYARMESLLGLHRTGGESGVNVDIVANGLNAVTSGFGDGGVIHSYTAAATSYFQAANPNFTAVTVFATQHVGDASYDAVIGTVTGARNVTFSTDAVLADDNMLGKAIDWVMNSTDAPTVSLHMSRSSEIVASRTDLDQSQETYDVDGPDGTTGQGIYDKLLPILEQWKAQYNFVGSYYANIGLNAPDQTTDWVISKPYYDQLMAMGNELGSHSYTHPENTNYLLPTDVTQAMIDAAEGTNLDAASASESVTSALPLYGYNFTVAQYKDLLAQALLSSDPMSLPADQKAVLMATFQFQFGTAGATLAAALGIGNPDIAVPGMPESLATARNIMQYVTDYLSGGASMIGAGYPSAFGYLSPADQQAVYIAPNMAFDFTLTDWLKLNPEQSIAEWAKEMASITTNSDLPILVWPWHDYGPTQWSLDDGVVSNDTLQMFNSVIAAAYSAGAEFVTLDDLAHRISAFEKTDFGYSISGDVMTVHAVPPTGGLLGTFALDFDDLGGKQIASVANWYAYDNNSVFLDSDGGTFAVTLGASAIDVTHITSIGMRAQLTSLTGDGTNLSFTIVGEGQVVIDTKAVAADQQFVVAGATIVSQTGELLTIDLGAIGTHNVTVTQMGNRAATDITLANVAELDENNALRTKIADVVVVDNDKASLNHNVVSVDDARFEIDATTGALYLKAGNVLDYEATPTITLNLTATDGALTFTKALTLNVTNTNDAPTGGVTVSGTAAARQVLTASTTTLADQDGLGVLSYVWQRSVAGGAFTAIAGALASTYTLADGDAGATVRVVVNYTDGHSTAESVTSAATAAVAMAPVVLTASVEDMLRYVTPTELAGASGGTISGLVASSGALTTNPDGSWTFIPVLNDDTGVTFSYKLTTASGILNATATMDLTPMTDVMGTTAANNLLGANTSDQYHGLAGNDTIAGGAGNDIFFGDEGNDRITGDAGNDRFIATINDGNDTYTGGADTDTYDLSRTSAAATVNLTNGTSTSTQTGTDTLATIENVIGSSGNDTITGSSGNNQLEGGLGNDTLNGAAGNDTLIGGYGNDTLNGGAGVDVMTGGAGTDTFVFATLTDSGKTATTRDIIMDFTHGEDKIDLHSIDANSTTAGDQAFTFMPTAGTAFTGVRGQLTFSFSDLVGTANDITIVQGDTNGDRVADFQIELHGLIPLTATDFIL